MSDTKKPMDGYPSEEAWVREKQCKGHAATISAELRYLADDVDRLAADYDRVGSPGTASHGAVSARIIHKILWALANMSLDQLVHDAQMADDARAHGR